MKDPTGHEVSFESYFEPPDSPDIQDEAYSEAMDEIGRLKSQHEDMLLNHAYERTTALNLLSEAMDEIKDLEADVELLAQNEIYHKALLTRAADALEAWNKYYHTAFPDLIAELRKAAK